MSTITSNSSGNWSAGGTWVGGVSPGSGDLAIIANGHTVTILGSDNITVGDGNATHYAIATSAGGTGILVCNDGFQLTLTSPCFQGHANWSIGRGIITYTNASDGAWIIGDGHNNHVRLDILGQSGTYGTLQSSSTGVLSFTGSDWLSAGLGSIRYYNLTKIGKSSINSWLFNLTSSGDDFSIRNCTLTNCGQISRLYNPDGASIIVIEDTTWSSTPGSCLGPSLGGDAITSGTRSIQGNYFDSSLGNDSGGGVWRDFTIENNLMFGIYETDTSLKPAASFGNNLVVKNVSGDPAFKIQVNTGQAKPNFFHIHSNAGALANVHGFILSELVDVTFEGWFIEPGDTDADGDFIMCNNPSSTRAHTVRYNLARLNKSGSHGGMFCSALGGANFNVSVRNNTYYSTTDDVESGSCAYGETYLGHADMYDEIVNNLVVSNTGNGYVFIRRDLRTFQDGASAANIHHNGKYQLSNGTLGVNGYGDKATSGTFVDMFSTTTGLGSGDVTANPSFVDDTRGITTWAVTRGYSGGGSYNSVVTDAYAAIAVDPRTRIPDLISWCTAGFAPTNAAFQATGSGGVDIGAVAVVAGAVKVGSMLLMFQ